MKLSDVTRRRLRMVADQADAECARILLEAIAAELAALSEIIRAEVAAATKEGGE